MARSFLIATSNPGKAREFEDLLGKACALVVPPAEDCPDVDENGSTYYENALKKAIAFYVTFQRPVLADDSGLELKALAGAPGIHTARFGGPALDWPQRWAYLYEQLADVPREEWAATFRCVLCYYDGREVPRFYEGAAHGVIVPEPRGGKGFGYDPVFYSPALGKTFAEATNEEKHHHSHRALAVKNFLAAG